MDLITVSTEVSLNQPSILSSGPDTIITCNRGSSVDASYGYAPDTFFSTPCKSENGLSSHSSTNLVMDSSLVPPAETIISSCKRIFVHPRLPNMTIPKGYTLLPKSDDKWVAFSPNWDSRLTSFVSNDHLVIFMSSQLYRYIYKHLIWPSYIDIFNLPLKMALATGIILNMHCCH